MSKASTLILLLDDDGHGPFEELSHWHRDEFGFGIVIHVGRVLAGEDEIAFAHRRKFRREKVDGGGAIRFTILHLHLGHDLVGLLKDGSFRLWSSRKK